VSKIALETELKDMVVRRCLLYRGLAPNKVRKIQASWSTPEDAKLLELAHFGTQPSQIANVLGRSEPSIRARFARIGPKDESLWMSEEDMKSALQWHEEGLSHTDIAERLHKRLHAVVVAITKHTGELIGEPRSTRPGAWKHTRSTQRATRSHHSVPPDNGRKSSRDSTISSSTYEENNGSPSVP